MTRNMNNETGRMVRALVEQGMKPKEICAKAGISLTTVYNYTNGLKFEKRESHDDIRDLRKAGLSVFEIRAITGKDPRTISRVLRIIGMGMTDLEKEESIKQVRFNNTHTEEWTKQYILEKSSGMLEYHSEYKNMDSLVKVKCTHCGGISQKSMVAFRTSHKVLCSICHYDPEKEAAKRLKELEREKTRECRAREKEIALMVKAGRGKQMSFNLCKCGVIISGKAMRCEDCRRTWENRRMRPSNEKWKQIRKNTDALRRVYERDGGICYICGQPCDYDDFYYKKGAFCIGTKYPTIDHVIPRSKGGGNTFNNFKLAHMICNSLKGDSYDEDKLEKPNSKGDEGSGDLSAAI